MGTLPAAGTQVYVYGDTPPETGDTEADPLHKPKQVMLVLDGVVTNAGGEVIVTVAVPTHNESSLTVTV